MKTKRVDTVNVEVGQEVILQAFGHTWKATNVVKSWLCLVYGPRIRWIPRTGKVWLVVKEVE